MNKYSEGLYIMNKIACCGYHITGSGVIDDLLREFDNVCQGGYEAESTFLKEPNMVSDLEYYLVENPQRVYTGYALKSFEHTIIERNVNFCHIFGKNWISISMKYLNSLIKVKYQGYTDIEIALMPWYKIWYRRLRRGVNLILPKQMKDIWCYNYYPSEYTYHSVLTEKDFLKKTQDYVDELCNSMMDGKKEFIMLDQLIPPTNPARYVRYVRDLKVIIVDRDPRDVYIQHMRQKDHVLPKDPHEFCTVWKDNRMIIGNIPDNCMYINFEDMIYKYDASVLKVTNFIGIDSSHHKAKRTRFNPDISIKNTKQWEKYPEYSNAIKIIERELSNYLYKF